jgi:uncharacterized protein YeaO (DUF488 family)
VSALLKVKRVYEEASRSDGRRILVDRLWPRGLSKEEARVDLWLKDLAPSNELRKWYEHDPKKWPEFKRRYFSELKDKGDELAILEKEVKKGHVTLLYGSREEKYNNAVALQEYLQGDRGRKE